MMWEGEPIPLSALQHAVFCLRQAALIHLERLWEENIFTAEGRVMHAVADKPGGRAVRGVRREMALTISSKIYGIAGVADVVEFYGPPENEIPYPVEFKRGKPKTHRADEVQLCAQAFCLEEMTGKSVPEGALFYGETKHRCAVTFDDDLRTLTQQTISNLQQMFTTLETPCAVYQANRCRACSLAEVCRPRLAAKSARCWRDSFMANLLEEKQET